MCLYLCIIGSRSRNFFIVTKAGSLPGRVCRAVAGCWSVCGRRRDPCSRVAAAAIPRPWRVSRVATAAVPWTRFSGVSGFRWRVPWRKTTYSWRELGSFNVEDVYLDHFLRSLIQTLRKDTLKFFFGGLTTKRGGGVQPPESLRKKHTFFDDLKTS